MPLDWKEIAEKDGLYEVGHFTNAAYHLLHSQIIYENGHGQSATYRIINRYQEEFREAFELFGITLRFDAAFRFIAAIPTVEKQPPMKRAEARLLLVLRKIYHEHSLRGTVEHGVATITIDELLQIHKEETGYELSPEVGELRDMLAPMKSHGVLRLPDADVDSEQPFDIAVLPGITALVNEGTLGRISDFIASTHNKPETTEETEATEGEGQ